jgi:hypothetical protein
MSLMLKTIVVHWKMKIVVVHTQTQGWRDIFSIQMAYIEAYFVVGSCGAAYSSLGNHFSSPPNWKFLYQMEGQENSAIPSKKCTTVHPPNWGCCMSSCNPIQVAMNHLNVASIFSMHSTQNHYVFPTNDVVII